MMIFRQKYDILALIFDILPKGRLIYEENKNSLHDRSGMQR